MITFDDLLDDLKFKVYSEDSDGKEILNERTFAISLLFIWHISYFMLTKKDEVKFEDTSIISKCNSIMDIMKNLSVNYSKLTYENLVKDVFDAYWDKYDSLYDTEKPDNYYYDVVSPVRQKLQTTCSKLNKKGYDFTSVLKHLTAIPPDDESGFIRVAAQIIKLKDGDVHTQLPSFLKDIINLKTTDRYIGIAPSSPYCIHSSYLVYGKIKMDDAVIFDSYPAETFMYLSLLHCNSGTILYDVFDKYGIFERHGSKDYYGNILSDNYQDKKRDKAIFIAPPPKNEELLSQRIYCTSECLFDKFEGIYSILDEDGIGVIVSPSCYFGKDENIERVVDFINSSNCIESIIVLPSQYKGDTTSTLLFLMKKNKEGENSPHDIQIIDIFDREGKDQLYFRTPSSKFPYSLTLIGKDFIKKALNDRNKKDKRIRYVSSVSRNEVFDQIVKDEDELKSEKDCIISTLLNDLEKLLKEASDFLSQ